MWQLRFALAVAVLLSTLGFAATRITDARQSNQEPAASTNQKTFALKGIQVSLSRPVLVGRSKDYFWFPQIQRLPGDDLVAVIRTCADAWPFEDKSAVLWSSDRGMTWSKPHSYVGESFCQLVAPSGDLLLLPLMLYPRAGGVGAPYHLIPKGRREVQRARDEMIVTGLPRPFLSPYPEQGAVAFLDGQTLKTKDGKYLAPIYGYFKDFDSQVIRKESGEYLATTLDGGNRRKKYNLLAAESEDGVRWRIRGTIADENCSVAGVEGPSESAICRLADGRLMCLFGQAKPFGKGKPYGQTWSSDEGSTWTTPIAASGPFSVEPCLAVMKDGTLVLSGGRPGLFLWFNADGTGKDWQQIDVRQYHNAYHSGDAITEAQKRHDKNTTGYAELVAVNDNQLLYIYDRIPNGWDPIPQGSPESFSVWVIQITLEKTR